MTVFNIEKCIFLTLFNVIGIQYHEIMSIRLKRKIETVLENYYANDPGKILLVDGARQTGKSFIIRETAGKHFQNFVEINLFEDKHGARIFADVDTVDKFNMAVSLASGPLSKADKENTIIFLDEIQEYPDLLPLLKFINMKGKYRYIGSGSALGVELSKTSSIPMGSIMIERLYPLDFEEFLWAMGVSVDVISFLRKCYEEEKSVDVNVHETVMRHLRTFLITGGLPEVVRSYAEGMDIVSMRALQSEIRGFYASDCAKYDSEHRLQIMRVYNLLPSFMEQKKKRVVYKDINPRSARSDKYMEEFDYLAAAGVALCVHAVSNPVFPLLESASKNLLKLYLNDVGLLSAVLFGTNINAVSGDVRSVNLGALYETFAAMELSAHKHPLFYYDNRAKGEVDFLINDYNSLSVLPVEVKSGRDYQIHSSISNMVRDDAYGIKRGIVLSSAPEVSGKGNIVYLPVYDLMFL